ncbi:MAG: hypothetical protein ACJ8HI_00240 [Massilia sp.]
MTGKIKLSKQIQDLSTAAALLGCWVGAAQAVNTTTPQIGPTSMADAADATALAATLLLGGSASLAINFKRGLDPWNHRPNDGKCTAGEESKCTIVRPRLHAGGEAPARRVSEQGSLWTMGLGMLGITLVSRRLARPKRRKKTCATPDEASISGRAVIAVGTDAAR